ncbi:hypothetical protein FF38_03276 [Lucilia cuprina]|uniref:Uncharacterized protein n=1 Tax=Lucilia cuprina TaxID=7375 RepID=A0A0L0CFJ2_LUCCU|nr:hypothetical protein FF38_03276 [Lucilia cuprina]
MNKILVIKIATQKIDAIFMLWLQQIYVVDYPLLSTQLQKMFMVVAAVLLVHAYVHVRVHDSFAGECVIYFSGHCDILGMLRYYLSTTSQLASTETFNHHITLPFDISTDISQDSSHPSDTRAVTETYPDNLYFTVYQSFNRSEALGETLFPGIGPLEQPLGYK